MTDAFRFADFSIDREALELRRGSVRVPLAPQAVRALVVLVEKQGALVTREELYRALWPVDTDVDVDRALNTLVRQIRRALGDSAHAPVFLQTYPGRGYRLTPPSTVRPPRQNGSRWAIWTAAVVALAAVGAFLAPRVTGRSDVPVAAREDFLLGRHLLEQPGAAQRAEAVTLLTRAAANAPQSPTVHAYLAGALAWTGRHDEARAALSTSFALDSSVPRSWYVASFLALVREWDWPRAEQMLRRAIALDNTDAEQFAALGFVLATAGRRAEAADALARARALDPVSAIVVGDIGQIYRYIGREREAAEACERANAVASELAFALDCVFEARIALGDTSHARAVAARIVLAAGADSVVVLAEAPDAVAIARFRKWRADRAAAGMDAGSYSAFGAALALSMANRPREALAALARDARGRGLGFITATVEPAFARLRSDTAFHRLVAPLVTGGAASPIGS